MATNLQPITDALAELTDDELHALMATAADAGYVAPGFMTWIEDVVECEFDRRDGLKSLLPATEPAIPAEEDGISLAVAMKLRRQFERDLPSVAALFDTIARVLVGGEQRR